MLWEVEALDSGGRVLCLLRQGDELSGLLTSQAGSPARARLLGRGDFHFVETLHFFSRDVRLLDASGASHIETRVGWGERCRWTLADGRILRWDFSIEWNDHRVIYLGEEEVVRLIPRREGKKWRGAEVRLASSEPQAPLWATMGFFLLLKSEQEHLQARASWSELGDTLGDLTLGMLP